MSKDAVGMDAEEVFRRLVEHPKFAQLCVELYTRFSNKHAERPAVREQLRLWLEPYQTQLSSSDFEQLFQLLYTAVLKTVWQCAQQAANGDAIDSSLFPDVSDYQEDELAMGSSSALSGGTLDWLAEAADEATIFPDLPQDADVISLRARSLMSMPAIPAVPRIRALAPGLSGDPEEHRDTSEVPAISADELAELLGKNNGPPVGWAKDATRFQTIPFSEGFYLLDRVSGSSWFMAAGRNEFVPCFFDFGNVASHFPGHALPPGFSPQAKVRSAIEAAEITVSFSQDQVDAPAFPPAGQGHRDEKTFSRSLDAIPMHEAHDGAPLGLDQTEHDFLSYETSPPYDEQSPSYDRSPSPVPFAPLYPPGMDPELEMLSPPPFLVPLSDDPTLDGPHFFDEEALSSPVAPPVPANATPPPLPHTPPQSFASQVAEQVPNFYSSEDLSALPSIGAYATELHPTLLPNRMRPGEGASYDALHGFDPLNQEILDAYPYPIARLYEAFLSENDPRLRLRLLMLVFIHLVKYAALPLVVQYLRHPELHDVATHQALLRLQSTRWSAWLEFLRSAVELFDGTDVPFTQEMVKSFRRLETERSAQERFLYTQRFLDPVGEERVSHLHLGLLEALVVYRDSFVHGFTPTIDQAEEDLLIYEPLLRTILEELRFVTRFPLLYTFQQRKDGSYLCYPLMGANPDPSAHLYEIPPQGLPTGRPLFLTAPNEPSKCLPLFPLLVSATPREEDSPIPSQHHAIFLFHGCSGRNMLYHNLWQVPYLSDEQFPYWQDLLQRCIYPIAVGQVTYPHIMRCATQWSARHLEQLRYQQQYYPELTVPRRTMQRVFADFLSSRSLALLLHGTPGVGKTTLLAHRTEQWLEQGRPVVWLRGPHIRSAEISSVLSSVLGIPVHSTYSEQTERMAHVLSPLLSVDAPMMVIFDDLEFPHIDEAVWLGLDRWLHQLASSPLADRIKVVLLVQSDVHDRLLERTPFPSSHEHFFSFEDSYLNLKPPSISFEIPPFFPDEVELAFRRYRNFQNGHGIAPFRPLTPWESLPVDASCREVLRHPLLLRLAMATYCQQELPAMLPIDELFQQYLEQVIEEKHAPLPIPERLQFLRSLLRQFSSTGQAVLTRADLLDSEEPLLLRALQNAHTDSPLIQLLHLGVLIEEWLAERCFLRFSSPLVFSFFLSREWMHQSPLNDASVMFDLSADEIETSPLPHSYHFLWLRLLRSQQSPTLCSWLHQHTDVTGHLLEKFLLMMIRTGERGWFSFVEELLIDAPLEILQRLRETVDLLLVSGYEDAAERLLNLLLSASASHTLPPEFEAELLFRCARLCELQGERDKAMGLYQQCRARFGRTISHPLLAQTYLRLASIARQNGDLEQAEGFLEQLQQQMDFAAFPSLQARVIRQQGNMAYEQSEFEQALRCYQTSLQLDESCDNFRGIAASLSNLGTVHGSRGELSLALTHYHRCLQIYQQLGDRKNVATTLNNIGIIYKNQGKHELALGQFLHSLRLREELGLIRDVIASHTNIAFIYKQMGSLEKAQEHTHQNLKLLARLQDNNGTAHALHQMGELHALRDERKEALSFFLEAQAHFDAHQDVSSAALVKLSMGQLHQFEGDLEKALECFRTAREQFAASQAAVDLIAALRSIAAIYVQREQFEQATNELQQALSLAEQLYLSAEALDIMIELAHVRLLRQDIPAAQAYTDRAMSMSRELDLAVGYKDVLTLQLRLSLREGNWIKLNEQLQQLDRLFEQIPYDTTPQRTAWALYEAARFCRDLDQKRSLELCDQALTHLRSRFFPQRDALLQLRETVRSSPFPQSPL